MMINVKEQKKFILPVNHVLAHLTPLTEKKIVVERHVVSPEEYEKKNKDIIKKTDERIDKYYKMEDINKIFQGKRRHIFEYIQ